MKTAPCEAHIALMAVNAKNSICPT